MPYREQIEKLITKLTELTSQNKIAWQETAKVNTYLTAVADFIVTLGKAESELYGGYSFQILDPNGRTVETALATPSSNLVDPQQRVADSLRVKDWERLRNLHELARRSALHSDEAV